MILGGMLLLLGAVLLTAGIVTLVELKAVELFFVCLGLAGLLILMGAIQLQNADAERSLLLKYPAGSDADCSKQFQDQSLATRYDCRVTVPDKDSTGTVFKTRDLTIWLLDTNIQIQEVQNAE